jgi:hypothetical protein
MSKHKQSNSKSQAQKARDKARAQKDKEYAARIKQLEKVGAYKPKDAKPTKYRKAKVNKLWPWYSPFLDKKSYFFIPTGSRGKAVAKDIKQRASNLNMITTAKGLFFAKPRGAAKATLQTKKGREPQLVIKSYEEDDKGWRARKETIPLVPVDALDKEIERWRKEARKIGPLDPNKKERIAFKVTEKDHEGFSRKIFDSVEDMINYMKGYKHQYLDRVKFFRHITLVKTTNGLWFKEHPMDERRGADRRRKQRRLERDRKNAQRKG